MAGLYDIDIKLDGRWQLTASASGGVPLSYDLDCLFQDIRLEAISQEGELFYDSTYGWSLMDFVQMQDDDLLRLEIAQRVKTKLSRRTEIDSETIVVNLGFSEDKISVKVAFKFDGDSKEYSLDIELDRVKVEVVIV